MSHYAAHMRFYLEANGDYVDLALEINWAENVVIAAQRATQFALGYEAGRGQKALVTWVGERTHTTSPIYSAAQIRDKIQAFVRKERK